MVSSAHKNKGYKQQIDYNTKSGVGADVGEHETPMRMGAPSRPGVVVENSDSLNVPTSPVTSGRHQNAVPATSPLPGGVNISEIDLSSPLNYGTPSSMGSIRTPRSGIRGTPVRARPDIRTDKRMRQVNIGSDAVSLNNHSDILFYFSNIFERRRY